MPAPLRHVLVVRTDHLGDMLLTLPAVHALKRTWPECAVTVLASPSNAEAARHHADVDRVEIDPLQAKGSGLRGVWSLARQIRRLDCDAAILAHPTPRLALAVYLAGVPVRVGTAYRGYSFLFNRRVHEHRRRPPWKHEAVYNLNLLRPLGIEVSELAPMKWCVGAEDSAAVAQLLDRVGVRGANLVAIHPGNAGSALNWSPRQYSELGRRLVADGWCVLITGGDSEWRLTAEVAADVGAGAVDLGGALTLAQLAALFSRCALYVGSATGPTHLAAAVGTPVVALYSPLRSSVPVRWRPLGQRVQVLQPAVNLVCPKCLGAQCAYYHCMERHLGLDVVERAARELLEGSFTVPVPTGTVDSHQRAPFDTPPKEGGDSG
jgi:heptosyltransferase-3